MTASLVLELKERNGATVYPDDFGAVGDGVTDDAPAINQQIARIGARGGGVVALRAKTYLVASSIWIGYSNVTLEGEGPEATLIRLANHANCQVIVMAGQAINNPDSLHIISNVTVQDLGLDGNYLNQDHLAPNPSVGPWNGWQIMGVLALCCANPTIRNVYAVNHVGPGIACPRSSGSRVVGNTVVHCGMATWASQRNPIDVEQVLPGDVAPYTNSQRAFVHMNLVFGFQDVGIDCIVGTNGAGYNIVGNIVLGDPAIVGSPGVSNLWGIALEITTGTSSEAARSVISSNNIHGVWNAIVANSQWTGGHAELEAGVTITGNSCYDLMGSGIEISGQFISVIGNTVYNFGTDLLSVSGATGIAVLNNNTSAGQQGNLGIIIQGNAIYCNQGATAINRGGIATPFGPANQYKRGLIVKGNHCYGPGLNCTNGNNFGIYIGEGTSGIELEGNICENWRQGIEIEGRSTRDVIRPRLDHNQCLRNLDCGIRLYYLVDNAVLHGNNCLENGQDPAAAYRAGIALTGINGATLEDNVCQDDQAVLPADLRTQQYGLRAFLSTNIVVRGGNMTGGSPYQGNNVVAAIDPGAVGIVSVRDLVGYNPQNQQVIQPMVPISGTTIQNPNPVDCDVYVSGGAGVSIAVGPGNPTEHYGNESFEIPGTPPNTFQNWIDDPQGGTIIQTSVAAEVYAGVYAAKLTQGPGAPRTAIEGFSWPHVVPGRSYLLSFWNRGDGANSPRYQVYDATNHADIIALGPTGIIGPAYGQTSVVVVAPAGCVVIQLNLAAPVGAGNWACFDLVSLLELPVSTGLGAGTYFVAAGGYITPAYGGAPSWLWMGR